MSKNDRRIEKIARFERDEEDNRYNDRRSNSEFRRQKRGADREHRRELYRELAYN